MGPKKTGLFPLRSLLPREPFLTEYRIVYRCGLLDRPHRESAVGAVKPKKAERYFVLLAATLSRASTAGFG